MQVARTSEGGKHAFPGEKSQQQAVCFSSECGFSAL